MKKLLMWFCLALAAVLATPAPSWCQVFGQFTGAQPLEVNTRLAGGYLTSSDNVFGLLAQLRLSFYPAVDFGFQGGFARQSFRGGDRTTLRLGTDLRYQVVEASADAPFSVAVGGGLGVETGDDWNVFSVGPNVVGSRAFQGNGEVQFTPFVGAGILFTNVNVGSLDDTDVSMPLRVGSELRLNQQISLTAELQLRLSDSFNDDVGFAVGINSPF